MEVKYNKYIGERKLITILNNWEMMFLHNEYFLKYGNLPISFLTFVKNKKTKEYSGWKKKCIYPTRNYYQYVGKTR